MNNNLSIYFAALIHYKVSTYVRKVFLKYAISSAFLKDLQSSLPNTDQEEKKCLLNLRTYYDLMVFYLPISSFA